MLPNRLYLQDFIVATAVWQLPGLVVFWHGVLINVLDAPPHEHFDAASFTASWAQRGLSLGG